MFPDFPGNPGKYEVGNPESREMETRDYIQPYPRPPVVVGRPMEQRLKTIMRSMYDVPVDIIDLFLRPFATQIN